MNSDSSFNAIPKEFPVEQKLEVGGSTCECFLVRLYGKSHFYKRLKPSLRTHPQYAAALRKEFETGFQLDHPHLVRYVAHTDDGILMDFIDGLTLDEFVRQRPGYLKNRRNADRFLRQLLSVVGYLHEHQIVHLDLKPANIMLTRVDHDVKLIDLGYCYTDTYSDTMGRTDKYAAPEQKDGTSPVGTYTDIYAVGRMLQTLPCAPYYKSLIKRCTCPDPHKRFQSTDEILRKMRSDALTRRIILFAGILLAILIAFLLLYRHHDASVATDASQSISHPDTVAASPSSVKDSVPVAPEVTDDTAAPIPEGTSVVTPDAFSVPQLGGTSVNTPVEQPSPKAVSSLKTISKEEVEQRLKTVVTPVFQRVMGPLSDSVWNRRTQEMYFDLSLPMLNQCGDAVRVLWNDLSRKYDIDERTFYRLYGKVLTSLSNDLYDRMLKNGKKAPHAE